jgi:hypothetical protein
MGVEKAGTLSLPRRMKFVCLKLSKKVVTGTIDGKKVHIHTDQLGNTTGKVG